VALHSREDFPRADQLKQGIWAAQPDLAASDSLPGRAQGSLRTALSWLHLHEAKWWPLVRIFMIHQQPRSHRLSENKPEAESWQENQILLIARRAQARALFGVVLEGLET